MYLGQQDRELHEEQAFDGKSFVVGGQGEVAAFSGNQRKKLFCAITSPVR